MIFFFKKIFSKGKISGNDSQDKDVTNTRKIINTGKIDKLTWKIEDSTLTIKGSGLMPDYSDIESGVSFVTTAPWGLYRNSFVVVVIENGVTKIGDWAFLGCQRVVSVSLSNTVKVIGKCSFSECYSLKSITIPNSVTLIKGHAFDNCTGLSQIISRASTPPNMDTDNVFNNVDKSTCELLVPSKSVVAYRVAAGWKEFTNIMSVE